MSGEYHVGDLSTVLQSTSKPKRKEKDVNEKLQALFSPRSQVSAVTEVHIDSVKPRARKQKDMKEKKALKRGQTAEERDVEFQKVGSKKRKHKDEQTLQETKVELENGGKAKKRKKSPKKKRESLKASRSPGFSPPAGIIHESLVNTPKEKAKKRKVPSSSESESEDETPSKKRKDGTDKKKMTRKRRDRTAQTNDNRTIFVGNLPLTIKKKKLMKMLKEYGAIESIRYRCFAPNDPNASKRVVAIKQNIHPDRHNCVAYVCFASSESAKKALKCNGRELDGLHLRVDMAARDQVRDIKKSVFVGNLPFDVEEERVRRHFEDCGTVANVRIVRDSKTSLGKGFCYVSFADTDAVAFSLRLNGSSFAGRQLRVMQCLPNPTKSVLDKKRDTSKKRDTAGKNKGASKKGFSQKGFRPSNQGPQPFQVIEAGKDWKKSKERETEEEPKKTKFQEKFEKTRQNRIEKGKTFNKVQEKANKKMLKKMKLKSTRREQMKENSFEQKKAGSHSSQEKMKDANRLKKAGLNSSQEKTKNVNRQKKAGLNSSQEKTQNTNTLKKAGSQSSQDKTQDANRQKKAGSQSSQDKTQDANRQKKAGSQSSQDKTQDANRQKKAGSQNSQDKTQDANRQKKAGSQNAQDKMKDTNRQKKAGSHSSQEKTQNTNRLKGKDKPKFENIQRSMTDKSNSTTAKGNGRTFVKSKFAASRQSDFNASQRDSGFKASPVNVGFNASNRKTFERKEKVIGNPKLNSFSPAKHTRFDGSGKRFENKKTFPNNNNRFPKPPVVSGNTSKTAKHTYFD